MVMPLTSQPTPWTVIGRREIGDGAGNVVQYTVSNLGAICLAVNAHDRLLGALHRVEAWLRAPAASRITEAELIDLVSSAIGRMGIGSLAAKIEDAQDASPELDRAVSVELDIPEAAYTSSIDMALTLVPAGFAFGFSQEERLNQATGQPAPYIVVELKSGDKVVSAAALTLPLAIAAAALKAKEI
jgi:hypothetical protein